MMPLWLDLIRTPMAAPETPALRRMRLTWMILCAGSGAGVSFVGPLTRGIGRAAPCMLAALLVSTLLVTALYLVRKHRADTAFLDCLEEDAG